MAKEQLIFFNADSVQNQILKMRFEMDGPTPNIVMRSSQIYTTLQFVKTGKYGCFLYSSMIDKFSDFNITGIPLNPPVRIKIGMVWKKQIYQRRYADISAFHPHVLQRTSSDRKVNTPKSRLYVD